MTPKPTAPAAHPTPGLLGLVKHLGSHLRKRAPRAPNGDLLLQERPEREASMTSLRGSWVLLTAGPQGPSWGLVAAQPLGCQRAHREPGSRPREGDPGQRQRGGAEAPGPGAVLHPCPHSGQSHPFSQERASPRPTVPLLLGSTGLSPGHPGCFSQRSATQPQAQRAPGPRPPPQLPWAINPPTTGVCSSPCPLGTEPGRRLCWGSGDRGGRDRFWVEGPSRVREAISDQSGAWR